MSLVQIGGGEFVAMRTKRFIVAALERLCAALDCVPVVGRHKDSWQVRRRGHLGCRLRLLDLSIDLDLCWRTKMWPWSCVLDDSGMRDLRSGAS